MRSSGRGVPMMDRERVPIRVLEDRLLADTAVDRLRDELDATRLELCLGGVVVVDVELERRGVRAEVDVESIDLHQRDRHGPGLELAGRHLAPLLPEGQPESLAVELPCGLPVLRREGDEVDAVEQLCVGVMGSPSQIPTETRRAGPAPRPPPPGQSLVPCRCPRVPSTYGRA